MQSNKGSSKSKNPTNHGISQDDEFWYDKNLKHWRSWGSWFSWGSPVGLGLFFISTAVTLWILSQAFGWN